MSKPATLQSERWTLDDALRLLHLDAGHDYQRPEVVNGSTVAVRRLGLNSMTLDIMRTKMPDYTFTEISRKPDSGHPGEWVRVDVEVRP